MITFFLLGKRASIPDSKQKGKEMKKLREAAVKWDWKPLQQLSYELVEINRPVCLVVGSSCTQKHTQDTIVSNVTRNQRKVGFGLILQEYQ